MRGLKKGNPWATWRTWLKRLTKPRRNSQSCLIWELRFTLGSVLCRRDSKSNIQKLPAHEPGALVNVSFSLNTQALCQGAAFMDLSPTIWEFLSTHWYLRNCCLTLLAPDHCFPQVHLPRLKLQIIFYFNYCKLYFILTTASGTPRCFSMVFMSFFVFV